MGRHLSPRTVRWYWSTDTLFWLLSIDHNIDVQSVFSWAPKEVSKCESKHWFPCGADGRSLGRAGSARGAPLQLQCKMIMHSNEIDISLEAFSSPFCLVHVVFFFCCQCRCFCSFWIYDIHTEAQHSLNPESIHINSHKPSRDWRQELYSLLAQPYYAGGGYTVLHDFSRLI